MRNELLLIATLIIEYAMVVVAYRYLGKSGLFAWISVATVLANTEVLILVDAFGLEMTLGNILFASTFLVTDILSENYSKRDAQRGVIVGIAASLMFVVISWSWLQYIPSANDVTRKAFEDLFGYVPRIVFASLAVFIIVQFMDVYLYHRIWGLTKRSGSSEKGLWLRNNLATITSQVVNAVLYNIIAFAGIYSIETLKEIIVANILIYIVTSLADTPFLYWARRIGRSEPDGEENT